MLINKIAIIVLNWNSIDDTKKCVASLLKQTYKNFQIVIVDNNSSEKNTRKQFEKLRDKHAGKIELIFNDQNLGFAGGENTGMQWAIDNDYDAVALLNPDATADRDWLKNLAIKMTKQTGIVTGLLLHSDGKTIDSTGDFYSIWGLPFPRGRNQPASQAPKSSFVFGASGGGSLYSCQMLREIGLFDENFFMYFEDADLSFRTQLAGYKVFYNNKAVAYHKRGASSSKVSGLTVYQTFKNLPLLFIKNVPGRLLWPIGVRFYFAYYVMLGHAVVRGNGRSAIKGFFAHLWYFWTSSIWQRWHIQHSLKKVDAKYIRGIIWSDMPPDQTGLRKLRKFFTGKV